MATSESSVDFKTLGNFRKILSAQLYRSSRPDKISSEDIEKFEQLNIKAIIDLRSMNEYRKASGQKLLNDTHQPYEVLVSDNQAKQVEFSTVDKLGQPFILVENEKKDPTNGKFHYIFDLISRYGVSVTRTFSPWKQVVIGCAYSMDKMFGTSVALRLIIKYHANIHGLGQHYKEIFDYCGSRICAVLRVLSEKQNVPALICCAIGKDRTGVITAILMSLLGADKQTIAEDYHVSLKNRDDYKEDALQGFANLGICHSFLEAERETMLEVLDYVDSKYGSMTIYLKGIGFDTADQEKLVSNIKD